MAGGDDPDERYDATRREFFRTFGRQTVRNAGALMGTAAEIRKASGLAARELLDLDDAADSAAPPAPAGATPGRVASARSAVSGAAGSFRSAYRLADDALLLLDTRDLPGRLTIVTCSEPTEVASSIRSGVVNGGPVLAEIAAYSLWATLSRSAGRDLVARDQAFRAAANTLRGARRDVHALKAAVDRMEQSYDQLTADLTAADGDALLTAMRAEADAIAGDAQLAHASLGRRGAAAIDAAATADPARQPDSPISLLMHADMGPLSCGMIGTGTAVLQSLVDLGRGVHVWVTEASPGQEGSRITALQLTQMDVPHTVIADAAVGWLLSSRRFDGALLRGDTVAANEDAVALIGSLNVARLAGAAGVPVYVVAPASARDLETTDGASLVVELRSPAEALAASATEAPSRPQVFGVRLNPTNDVVPRDLVAAFLTD